MDKRQNQGNYDKVYGGKLVFITLESVLEVRECLLKDNGFVQSLHHNFRLFPQSLQKVKKMEIVPRMTGTEISAGMRVGGFTKLVLVPFGGIPAGMRQRSNPGGN